MTAPSIRCTPAATMASASASSDVGDVTGTGSLAVGYVELVSSGSPLPTRYRSPASTPPTGAAAARAPPTGRPSTATSTHDGSSSVAAKSAITSWNAAKLMSRESTPGARRYDSSGVPRAGAGAGGATLVGGGGSAPSARPAAPRH